MMTTPRKIFKSLIAMIQIRGVAADTVAFVLNRSLCTGLKRRASRI